jgi:Fur family ferric uptake transcriptional regulator
MPAHTPADTNAVSHDLNTAMETFRTFLSRKGLRVTHQRIAIFEAALSNPEHFTAEELLEYARKIDRSVSRATIYRTLPILTESQLVREIDVGKDYKFYLASHGKKIEQAQVVDIESDKIYEIDAPFLEWYARSIAEKIGLEVVSQRLQVHARPIRSTTQQESPRPL